MNNELGELKQVIVVRKDLNMSPGKLAAQVAHASLSAVMAHFDSNFVGKTLVSITSYSHIEAWINGSQTKIVVAVNSEKELTDIYENAMLSGITSAIIKDEGRTELGIPTLTTCAIGPHYSAYIDKITKHLKLY